MLKVEGGGGGEPNSWARVCDTCRSAPCTVYCRADSAYLCSTCDTRIHGANQLASRHERVYVCEACERAPAAFLCKADAASLCASCDAEIHSANPLARRHQRVPIMPVSYGPTEFFNIPQDDADGDDDDEENEGDEDETASWLLLNNPAVAAPTGKKSSASYCNPKTNESCLLGDDEEADEYLDVFEYYSGVETQLTEQYSHSHSHSHSQSHSQSQSHQEHSHNNSYATTDSVVPCAQDKQHQQHYQNFLFGMEFETKPAASTYTTSSAHHVPVSSMDVGIVPDTSISDLSLSNPRPPKGTIDLFSGPPMQMPIQLSPLDREARVMRYREKKKNRKFEKTIRYASRKAYAETRPRIKGRFAKRTDVEAEIDDMFPNSFLAETGYGVVPSF